MKSMDKICALLWGSGTPKWENLSDRIKTMYSASMEKSVIFNSSLSREEKTEKMKKVTPPQFESETEWHQTIDKILDLATQ